MSFPDGTDCKQSPRNAGDWGSVPGLGRSPGEGNGNPLQDYLFFLLKHNCFTKSLQYSCLKNSMDKGSWRATIHGVTKSWKLLSDEHLVRLGQWLNIVIIMN